MNDIIQTLKAAAPSVFADTPVLFAYLYGSYAKALSHPFSDLDIGIYVEDLSVEACLKLELALALRFDDTLNRGGLAEVRILNHLPLTVKGRILGEAILIYCKDEEKRIAFETQVRCAYFDFLPVIHYYRDIYRKRTLLEAGNDIF
jgi:predicted nucleotidyltransferase